jgi:hypothetical protein
MLIDAKPPEMRLDERGDLSCAVTPLAARARSQSVDGREPASRSQWLMGWAHPHAHAIRTLTNSSSAANVVAPK